jgi:phosphoribosylglycinamide formyltransferase
MADLQQPSCRILVMASGNGSNFQELINAVATGQIPNSKIVRLIVNRAKAYATTRADQAGIMVFIFTTVLYNFLTFNRYPLGVFQLNFSRIFTQRREGREEGG